MSRRTTPDPVFAAAAQEELERRVRTHRGSSTGTGRRRSWVVELSAVAGLAILAAGVVLGVQALRPALESGGAPVGSITRTAEPPPVSTTPTTPTPVTTPPPSPGTPTASTSPTLPAPTTPPATSDPSTAPPTTGTTTLIGPSGAVSRTDAEIRAGGRSRGFSDVWAEQGILDRDCMARQGFRYDPFVADAPGGMSASDSSAYTAALYGPPTDQPYDWRTAGCHGRSVHETGQDDDN